MSLGAGIRTTADIEIRLQLSKSAAWNKMQTELGDLKRFLNDIGKTIGIQKPISEYDKLSKALAAANLELKNMKASQAAQGKAVDDARRAQVVYVAQLNKTRAGQQKLAEMSEEAAFGLTAGWAKMTGQARKFNSVLHSTVNENNRATSGLVNGLNKYQEEQEESNRVAREGFQIVRETTTHYDSAARIVNTFAANIDELATNVSRHMNPALRALDEEMVQLNRTMKAEDALFDEMERQMRDAARREYELQRAMAKTETAVNEVTERFEERNRLLDEKRAWQTEFNAINASVRQNEARSRIIKRQEREEAALAVKILKTASAEEKRKKAVDDASAAQLTLVGRINKYERALDAVFRASFRLQMAGNDLLQVARSVTTHFTGMMNLFGDFEYMMNRAAGAMSIWDDAADKGMVTTGQFQKALLNLSEEMRLFPAQEVAEAAYYWGSTTGQAVESTRDLELAMGALNPGYEATIKGVYSILAQYYNGAISQATTVTEQLFYATQTTAAELPDLIQSFKMVGPVAKASGVQFEQLVKIFGELADLGVRGTMAGRAFRQLFIQLVRPSGPAIDALNELFNVAKDTVTEFQGKSYVELMFPKGKFVGI
jgi:hypothetical protein